MVRAMQAEREMCLQDVATFNKLREDLKTESANSSLFLANSNEVSSISSPSQDAFF